MRRTIGVITTLALGAPTLASGQVAWDGPALLRPGAPAGLSVFLVEVHPGDGLGGMATWRKDAAPVGLGFRAGVAEGPGDEVTSAFFGLDLSGPLIGIEGPGEPQLLWWTGAGLGVGDDILASFPLGIVAGWQAQDEGVSFAPYAGAHLALDLWTGPGDDLDLDVAVDLGVDITFESNFMVRFGAALGGRDALAIGIRLPTGS